MLNQIYTFYHWSNTFCFHVCGSAVCCISLCIGMKRGPSGLTWRTRTAVWLAAVQERATISICPGIRCAAECWRRSFSLMRLRTLCQLVTLPLLLSLLFTWSYVSRQHFVYSLFLLPCFLFNLLSFFSHLCLYFSPSCTNGSQTKTEGL